jgi:hypothetical protein
MSAYTSGHVQCLYSCTMSVYKNQAQTDKNAPATLYYQQVSERSYFGHEASPLIPQTRLTRVCAGIDLGRVLDWP